MKVKELIKELSEYDPEMDVYIDDGPYCLGYGPAEQLYVGRENETKGLIVEKNNGHRRDKNKKRDNYSYKNRY